MSQRSILLSLFCLVMLGGGKGSSQENNQNYIFKPNRDEFIEIKYQGKAAGEIYDLLKKNGATVERIGACKSRVEDFLVQCERHGYPTPGGNCVKEFDRCRLFAGSREHSQKLEINLYKRR